MSEPAASPVHTFSIKSLIMRGHPEIEGTEPTGRCCWFKIGPQSLNSFGMFQRNYGGTTRGLRHANMVTGRHGLRRIFILSPQVAISKVHPIGGRTVPGELAIIAPTIIARRLVCRDCQCTLLHRKSSLGRCRFFRTISPGRWREEVSCSPCMVVLEAMEGIAHHHFV